MDYQQKVQELGLELPPAAQPVGSYVPVLIVDGCAYVSGQIAKDSQGQLLTGTLGKDLDLSAGQRAARFAALNVLSIMQEHVGFSKIERLIKVVGYVQTTSEFKEIPQVINGASDLFVEVFGEQGVHSRSAVGAASLPLDTAVEIDAIFKLKSS